MNPNIGDNMPSKSKAQAKFMRAVAHGMKPKGGGPSKKQAKEWMGADQAKGTSNLPQRIAHAALKGSKL